MEEQALNINRIKLNERFTNDKKEQLQSYQMCAAAVKLFMMTNKLCAHKLSLKIPKLLITSRHIWNFILITPQKTQFSRGFKAKIIVFSNWLKPFSTTQGRSIFGTLSKYLHSQIVKLSA